MKRRLALPLLILLTALFITGCQIAESDATQVGDQFQRGMSGRGQIVPNDPTQNSFGSDYR